MSWNWLLLVDSSKLAFEKSAECDIVRATGGWLTLDQSEHRTDKSDAHVAARTGYSDCVPVGRVVLCPGARVGDRAYC